MGGVYEVLIVEGVFKHHVHHEDIVQIRVVDIVRPDAVEGPGRSIINRGMGKMAGGWAIVTLLTLW